MLKKITTIIGVTKLSKENKRQIMGSDFNINGCIYTCNGGSNATLIEGTIDFDGKPCAFFIPDFCN
ncbi:hypothetical protein [Aquimarina algicola]|uniref:Uncharacterized protein n=1 Tax=Aquimarina algicola TaxID=2589995 RepID=A0A504J9C7_9FLAO|nr:hypothetical protein [Aquimarina algicola]TPN85112.1 hypothetical protein FHK87_13860 [Aquimarina algicola]